MPYIQTNAPASEPVTLAQLKLHCKVDADITTDDDLITALGVAARELLEHRTGRQLVSATWALYLDEFPEYFELLPCPVTAVTSITYYDIDDALQTLDAESYIVDLKSTPARVVLDPSYYWPTTYPKPNAVTVTFTAAFATIPERLKLAIKWLVAHWYKNRESATKDKLNDIPYGVESIIRQTRIYTGVC